MPTSVKQSLALRENYMRKTCGQTVESLRDAPGTKFVHFPHPAATAQSNRAKLRLFLRFVPTPSPSFPHHLSVYPNPLASMFSPLSTGPITTTTKYINN
jgi:hypothetical protein